MNAAPLGWSGIVRIGLVQTALGAVVVLMTSTINRVMVVELALPAIVPGLLVASHYGIQILRPAWGYGADFGGRRTPWIVGGLATLALGGIGAALGAALTASNPVAGLALAAVAFLLVGVGAGAAGTSALAMLATRVVPSRRAAAATTVWVMMILGFAISAPLAGHFLDPFSQQRLIVVTSVVCVVAFLVGAVGVIGLETEAPAPEAGRRKPPFREAFAQVWREPAARRFTIFIFVSMLAYSMQELLVEPFAGVVFGMTPGATTKLAGLQHGGVLLGMIGVALAATAIGGPRLGSLRLWTVGGCLASGASLVALAASGYAGLALALRVSVFALGVSNGAFAVAAIGSMMSLAGAGAEAREGTRMGLWGAAQAIAFGCGGVLATMLVDVTKLFVGAPLTAYALVFVAEAALFVLSAALASRIARPPAAPAAHLQSAPVAVAPAAHAAHAALAEL
jgi:BCD family chlorophyll transporter-like MFS transporter